MIASIKKMLQGKSYFLEDTSESDANEPTASTPEIEEKPETVSDETAKPESTSTPSVEAETESAEATKSSQKAAQPEVVATASNPLEIIKAAVQKSAPQVQAPSEQSEATFAPDYLLYTKTQAKRRPGACMNSFLDMARQMR
jgi:archaellum component FlaD/FlaE